MNHWERQPWEKPRMECSEGPGYAPVEEIRSLITTAAVIGVVVACAIVGTWIGGLL